MGKVLSVQYLCVISDPPDVGDRSHLAGPQNGSQVHFLIPDRHEGSREMDIFQLTYSGTQIHHRVNSLNYIAMCKNKEKKKKRKEHHFFFSNEEKRGLYGWGG